MCKMYKKIIFIFIGVSFLSLTFSACKTPISLSRKENTTVPASFNDSQDTTNSVSIKWKTFFKDPYLNALIDTALQNNQELNIMLQEIQVSRNEIRARKGEYLPFLNGKGGAGVEKSGRYTRNGALEANVPVASGKDFPDPLGDFMVGAYATWEVDIWHKLRNAKKAAVYHYLASIEGKNFMVTNLVSEIARSYYELIALDNHFDLVKQNIQILSNALEIVKLQKEAARTTQLAVVRFEAEVFKVKSQQFIIQQQITETENKINFLLGRFGQPIERNATGFIDLVPDTIHAGIPSQLLANRPDIRQAENDLAAAKLDIKVAKARFYPSLGISAGVGLQAFNPTYFIKTPESLLFSLAGDLVAPLVNRNSIKATYYSANAKQVQAAFNYEKTILNAFVEVSNQVSKVSNLEKTYSFKSQQVDLLQQSRDISVDLFKNARANYMEVLLTQRDVLEARVELIETKKDQLNAVVNIYRALGGGW